VEYVCIDEAELAAHPVGTYWNDGGYTYGYWYTKSEHALESECNAACAAPTCGYSGKWVCATFYYWEGEACQEGGNPPAGSATQEIKLCVPGSNLCGYPTCWDDANGAYAVSFNYDPGDPDNDDVWDTEEICKLHCIDPAKWYCVALKEWIASATCDPPNSPDVTTYEKLQGSGFDLACHAGIYPPGSSYRRVAVKGPFDSLDDLNTAGCP
jgi:hypothetical protein